MMSEYALRLSTLQVANRLDPIPSDGRHLEIPTADHPDFDTKAASVQSPPSPGGIASTPASSDCPQHCMRNSLPAIAPERAHCQDE
jgi:hypothetical protein